MSMSPSEVLRKCRGLQAQLARIRENYGQAGETYGIAEKIETDCPFCGRENSVEKNSVGEGMQKIRCSHCRKLWEQDLMLSGELAKGTGVNTPRIASIDDKRDEIAELLAESVSRGDKVVRNAMLGDETFVDGLRRITTNEPGTGHDLLTAIEEEGRSHPTRNEGVDTGAATVEDFKDALAHPKTPNFARAKDVMHYAKLLAQGYRLRSPVGISEGQSFFALAIKKSDAQEKEWSIRKAAHLDGRMEPEKVKLGRRMHPGEILR
jgi:hypothetical protein